MASIAGKTKIIVCTTCGDSVTASLYAKADGYRCPSCKKVNKKVGTVTPRPVINAVAIKLPETSKPVKLILLRNRQEIEGNIVMDSGELIERIPVEWKTTKNELDYLSISKISAYEQCPAKFNRNYMQGSQEDSGNVFTWFGSILHEVAEFAEKMYYENGITTNPLVLYDEAWKKRPLTDLTMYKEGRELTLDYFARNPIGQGSYHPLNIDGKAAIELEYRGPFAEVPVFGNVFDYIGELDAETGIIKDYKSNRRPFTGPDLDDSLQLQVYEIIARRLFPQYKKWVTGYELFRFGWQECPQRTPEDLEAIECYVNDVWEQIKNDNTWVERLNVYCGYCNDRSSCKKYCDYVNNPQVLIDTIITDKTDFSSIEKSRESYNILEKILKDRKDELSNLMKVAIESSLVGEDPKPLVIDGKELYLQAQSRPYYDYYPTRNLLMVQGKSDILDRCSTVNKTKLDAELKKDPQLALELKKCMIQSYSAPYIMKRKAK